jgi:putative restriction endonuclease
LRCTVGVGAASELTAGTALHQVREPIDRRYTTVEANHRIHQAEFRELVLGAYNRRCAISNLPVPQLLQAAHIIPDRDRRGRPEVTNGLCLSTLHHNAYDRNLLGIDPDGQIHIAESVVAQHDGPTLEAAIKEDHGRRIHLPRHAGDRPDQELLAARFEEFRAR